MSFVTIKRVNGASPETSTLGAHVPASRDAASQVSTVMPASDGTETKSVSLWAPSRRAPASFSPGFTIGETHVVASVGHTFQSGSVATKLGVAARNLPEHDVQKTVASGVPASRL